MSNSLRALRACILALMAASALAPACLGAGPHGKHRPHARHILTAAEGHAARQRKADLARKLNAMHGHIRQVKAKIHHVAVQEHRISESLGTVQARLARTRERLVQVDERLAGLSEEHRETVDRLEATQVRLAGRRRVLAERIRYNYERGRTSYAEALMRSQSVHELLSRSYYVRAIVRSDTDLIQGVRDDIVHIEADKRTVERQEARQRVLDAEIRQRKAEYAADAGRERALLHSVRVVKHEAEDELDELESESSAMNDRIRQLSEALRLQQQALRAMAHGSGRRHGGGRRSVVVLAWRGRFARPCNGPLTSGFGYRFNPILHRRRMHTGVDFGAGYGASIYAAAPGVVILAGYVRGYGNCVVIDHGGGLATLYGHASSLIVSRGETVRKGQVIARVGATGLATGPHLHFEVRRNGVPVRPF
jgi:murein DD-endopeptidase MepM/ murein hydrolase activator NlpD